MSESFLLPPATAPGVPAVPSSTPSATSDLLLDVEGMATLLHASVKAVYGLYERGRLPRSIGPGRKLLWERAQTLQFLRSRASSSARRSQR